MRKWILLILIALMTILANGVLMPALFGLKENFLNLILLTALILVFGPRRWVIWFGIVFAFCVEFSSGLYLGSLVLPWLLAVWLWYLMTSVFSLKPFGETETFHVLIHLCIGLVVLAAFSAAYVILEKIFYDHQVGFSVIRMAVRQPVIWITAVIALALYLFLLRLVEPPAKPAFIYG
ncbi:MAG TPA: hypothetical protein VFK07_00235 [Candidatus Paceibacterota bacterium]|nr:hypothetical protein [Candidatus Paceibacterota bacterium]